jgi:hypothetical protein
MMMNQWKRLPNIQTNPSLGCLSGCGRCCKGVVFGNRMKRAWF